MGKNEVQRGELRAVAAMNALPKRTDGAYGPDISIGSVPGLTRDLGETGVGVPGQARDRARKRQEYAR